MQIAHFAKYVSLCICTAINIFTTNIVLIVSFFFKCQFHFDEDQWEQKKVDSSRKLRCSAIPSLLSLKENSSSSPYVSFIDRHNYCRLSNALAIISHQSRSILKDITEVNINNTPIGPAAFVTSVNLMKKISASETQSSTFLPVIEIMEEESVKEKSMEKSVEKESVEESMEKESVEKESIEESVETLKQRLELKEKELAALQTKHISIQKVAGRVFKSYCNIKRQHETMKTKLIRIQDFYRHSSGLFAEKLRQDQLKALYSKTTRGRKWSVQTITDGLIYKMKWDTQGYSDFVKKYPIFPSVRTLQEAVEHMKFESGILEEVFDVIQCQIPHMKFHEIHCMIVLDEMAIKPGEIYDNSNKRIIGLCFLGTSVWQRKHWSLH